MEDLILKVENVSKYYPGVTALNNVSFTIKKGEVRALVGENGAGKSTLIKCIMGVERPDTGHVGMNYNGEWVINTDALEAQRHGVFANYQNVNIADELSVAENYFLGNQPRNAFGIIDWKKMNEESSKILHKFSMDIDPREKINRLPLAMQAMVTISKIDLNKNIKLVIFDEPTALLENEKTKILFDFIKSLKEQGVSVIYISHRLEEIMDICDSVTVLKDGTYVDTQPIENVSKDILISMMVGREMSDIYNIRHFKPGKELLRVEHFSDDDNFRDINFQVHEGEIVGFVGLVGAGRSEVMRALCGLSHKTGDDCIRETKTMEKGISFLTEERRKDGLALQLPISININMNSYKMISSNGVISLSKEIERAKDFCKKVNVKTPNISQLVGNLSGGNQQKVVIAKLLCLNPDILIFDEPTVGVDVGAKEEIYKIMEDLTSQGKGIILISSYLPEVMGLSDRLIVMAGGQVTGDFNREEVTKLREEDVLLCASHEAVV